MGLSSTLNIAQSSLSTNAALTSLLSRNIAGVNDANYSRKTANLTTNQSGAAVLTSVSRASDDALFASLLSANADSASSQALSDGLDKLENTVSLTSSTSSSTDATVTGNSPATLLGTFTSALEQYQATPDNSSYAQAAVTAAKSLASGLNSASTTIQGVRTQADKDIAGAVTEVNSLLTQFTSVNQTIIKGTATGSDISDALDQRDQLLSSLSKDIGITTVSTSNGGTAIFTDSGVPLFQESPRTVTFTPTTAYATGTVGGTVSVDGVPVTGSSAIMGIKSGKIAGLTTLRDTTTVNYQDQLDQIASTLVTSFADTDQTGGSAATIPGLFTYPGAPDMPADRTGLAASITVNANVDPSQGGDIDLLRDGGIGDPSNSAYSANSTGAAAFSDHLTALLANVNASQSFDPTSGGTAQGTLAQYAQSSVSWLEATRQAATDATTTNSALATQTASSLSSETGVNLDDQLSKMLDLEHSYQASAELISTVKDMYTSLFSAIQ